MKAMIMAAGLGTRLLPLTRHTSKPMVPVLGRPVMEHLVRLLVRHEVRELAVNLHYHPQEISDHFAEGEAFEAQMRYHLELELSGTAGGVGQFRTFLADGTFLVMSGDALTDIDLGAFLARHRAAGGIATLAVTRVADPSHYGVVVTDADRRVTGFQEKPAREEARSHLCNCGIYAFEPAIFDYVPSDTFVDWARDVFPRLLADDVPFHVCPLEGYWSDVGGLTAYRDAVFHALDGRVALAPAGELLRPGVWAGAGVRISSRARIEPPVFIGAGGSVASGASLLGPAVLEEACVVDADASVGGSVLWRRCSVGAGAQVSDALLGDRVLVGPGAGIQAGAVVAGGCRIDPGANIGEGAVVDVGGPAVGEHEAIAPA